MKHEYDAGEIAAMAGGSLRHNAIAISSFRPCKSTCWSAGRRRAWKVIAGWRQEPGNTATREKESFR
jgi:hypothetical protein